MKTRMGFVSNSSSSSFVIKLSDLTGAQVSAIENHSRMTDLGESFEQCEEGQQWRIHIGIYDIAGYTDMDNFDMRAFLRVIGVKEEVIRWTE